MSLFRQFSGEMMNDWLPSDGRHATSSGSRLGDNKKRPGHSRNHSSGSGLSERRGAVTPSSLEIPSPDHGVLQMYPGTSGMSPSERYNSKEPARQTHSRSPRSPRGPKKKRKWRSRIKTCSRATVVFLFLYFFGRTAYQLTFFLKAGLHRYWYHPLEQHRPLQCRFNSPPKDFLLAPLPTPPFTSAKRPMEKSDEEELPMPEDLHHTPGAKYAILTLCDSNTGYICVASAANKRRYAAKHGYDLIVVTEVADASRPAAWSKILEVRKHLPKYEWVFFIDVDTLIMNPNVKLEDIADDSVDQVIAADHNGINSGVWLVKNSRWMMWFLDELWAQTDLVTGPYLFHYEQRAFHHLFQTVPWTKQKSVKGKLPYPKAAEVRAHSKIVNQCVFNSLLPWYVTGDFVVHLAGLKGVWECLIFWHYFDISQENSGMRITDWSRELGGESRAENSGKGSTLWGCMKFKTLFR